MFNLCVVGSVNEGDLFKVIAKEDNTLINYWYFANDGRTTRWNSIVLFRGGHRDLDFNESTPVSIRVSDSLHVIKSYCCTHCLTFICILIPLL